MANSMDSVPYNVMAEQPAQQQQHYGQNQNQNQGCPVIPGMPGEMCDAMTLARQNPQAFEQQVAQRNPQGYQEALRIRNSQNPRAEVLKLAQARGVPPHILRMFGL